MTGLPGTRVAIKRVTFGGDARTLPGEFCYIDGTPATIEHAVAVSATRAIGTERQLTLTDFVRLYRFDHVVDYEVPNNPRFEILVTMLSPGGQYEIVGAASQPRSEGGLPKTLSAGISRHFSSFLTRRCSISEDDGSDRVVVSKHPGDEWQGHATPLLSLAPGAATSHLAATYPRIKPAIYGSPAMAANIRRDTHDYADQFVPAQLVARLGKVIISGHGQIHLGNFVVEESFANLHHTGERGLIYRAGTSSWYASVMPLWPRPNAPVIEEPSVILKQTWDANYGHWLVDSFSRLAGLVDRVDLSELKFIVSHTASPAMNSVIVDTLALLGIGAHQIVAQATHPFTALDAIYPSPLSRAPFVKHPAAIRFLESLVDRAKASGGRSHAPGGRVYLSRGGGRTRRLLNEEELRPLLGAAGYVILDPAELTLVDQIVTLASASHVIGNMGAALTNLAFAPSGVRVAALANTVMRHDYFYDIACHKQGAYIGIQGEGAAKITDDFHLDMRLVTRALDENGFLG